LAHAGLTAAEVDLQMEPLHVWHTPWAELDVILRLILAAVVGGVIGLDRERAHKWAGIRTLLLVCLGSTLFTIVSIYGFGDPSDTSRIADPARLAAGIVVGIGFLGAGVILHSEKGVVGLTTAAAVWAVAAVGVAIGCGLYLIALATAVLMLVALRLHTKHPHD
jgi:putative Mg2+ transporter-C (MgtC) family protein